MGGAQWNLLNKEILRISGFPEMHSISVMLKKHTIRGILSIKNHLASVRFYIMPPICDEWFLTQQNSTYVMKIKDFQDTKNPYGIF